MLSVFSLFAQLFPEHVKVKLRDPNVRSGLTRLQFNKLGYAMYAKEQSRRVPAPHAKPGNPGYGFKRARWRSPFQNTEDERILRETMISIGITPDRCEHVRHRVDEYRTAWDHERRPSRPAGPGRPRGKAPLSSPTSAASGDRSEATHSPRALLAPLWPDAAADALSPSDVVTAVSPSCAYSHRGGGPLPLPAPASSALPPFLPRPSLPCIPGSHSISSICNSVSSSDRSQPAAGPWHQALGMRLVCGVSLPRLPVQPPLHSDEPRRDVGPWAAAVAAGFFPFGVRGGAAAIFEGLSSPQSAAAAAAEGRTAVTDSLGLLAAAAADSCSAQFSARRHAAAGGGFAGADLGRHGGDGLAEPPAKRAAVGDGLLGCGGDLSEVRLPGPTRDSAGSGDAGDGDGCPAGAGGVAGGGGKLGPQPDAEEAAGGPVNKASLKHLLE